MDKNVLREEIKAKRAKVNPRDIAKFNKDIVSHISVSRMFLEGKVIMGFLAMDSEAQIDKVLQLALTSAKIVCVPKIIDNQGTMQAVNIASLDNMPKDSYGIRTPAEPTETINPADIDLVLVPGLGFTSEGGRLGRGKGYYDRFLLQCTKAKFLGVGYEFQVVKELPLNGHDVKIHYLVTEKALRVCK